MRTRYLSKAAQRRSLTLARGENQQRVALRIDGVRIDSALQQAGERLGVAHGRRIECVVVTAG